MAILNFVKSSSSKNKVAAISPSGGSSSESAKTANLKNHVQRATLKSKTPSDFKVSAMAYVVSRS